MKSAVEFARFHEIHRILHVTKDHLVGIITPMFSYISLPLKTKYTFFDFIWPKHTQLVF